MLIVTIFYLSKWNKLKKIIKSKENIFYLGITGVLIFVNWSVWIFAVSTNRVLYLFSICASLYQQKHNSDRVLHQEK